MKPIVLAAALLVAAPAHALDIVAAENFYGDVAEQIGGPDVSVTSILSNPNQDPHLFEATPSVARAIAASRIAVYSGIDYDPWMERLLGASHRQDRHVIDVAALTGRHVGDNPHIWYDTRTMLVYAMALAEALSAADPLHAPGFHQRLAQFEASLKPINSGIARLRARLTDTEVTATEPVLGYLFDAIGLRSRNQAFQLAVMNGTEPSAADIAAFETDLRDHRVRLLVTNSQASDPVAKRMAGIARHAGIPVVAAAETEPPGQTYQAWMQATLAAIDKALPAPGQ